MTLEQRNEWLETQLRLLTTRVQELEHQKEFMRQGLIACAFSPATNEQWNSHHQLIQGVQKVQKQARNVLEKLK